MKKIIFLFTLIALLSSCNSRQEDLARLKDRVKNEVIIGELIQLKNISTTEAELQGQGNFLYSSISGSANEERYLMGFYKNPDGIIRPFKIKLENVEIIDSNENVIKITNLHNGIDRLVDFNVSNTDYWIKKLNIAINKNLYWDKNDYHEIEFIITICVPQNKIANYIELNF